MMRYKINHKRWLMVSFIFTAFLLLQLLAACGNDNSNDNSSAEPSETTGVALSIRWHDALQGEDASVSDFMAAIDCGASGVAHVICNVYDPNGSLLVEAGPWQCTQGGATIENIPSGPDRTFVILAQDSAGNTQYHGQTSGITIEPDSVTERVVVDAFRFAPTLTAPGNEAEVNNGFAFEWEGPDNAGGYQVQVSPNDAFNPLIIDEPTSDTTYVPSFLETNTGYFWRILAIDRFGNIGGVSEERSFTTTSCTYEISEDQASFEQIGGPGGFTVTAPGNCDWTATTDADVNWITITAPADGIGVGVGTVDYTVAPNNTATERDGIITVGGQPHTVTQQGLDCTFEIDFPDNPISSDSETGIIGVTATPGDCPWTAESILPWFQITAVTNRTVSYTVAANPSRQPREGTIVVAEETHNVIQSGAVVQCAFELDPEAPDGQFPAEGGSDDFDVIPSFDTCTWDAVSNNDDWIHISEGANGTGPDTVSYIVDANPGPQPRQGSITAAGRTYTITQAGAEIECTFDLDPPSIDNFPYDGAIGSFDVIASNQTCSWTAAVNPEASEWVQITMGARGTGNDTVEYEVLMNDGSAPRSAIITVEDREHTITQNAAQPGDILTSD